MKNLFRHWDNLEKELSNKYIMLFLDYDGTLTPIVSTPEKAFISREVKELLIGLSKSPKCKLAIISGRALKDIKNIIGLKNIIYSGNHGLEIEGPKIKFEPLVSPKYRMILRHIKNNLQQKISYIRGAFVEDKGFSLSLHYRLVDKKQIPQIKTIFHETVISYLVCNKIKIKPGKMVLEIRPPIKWDKGRVVLWLLTRQIFAAQKGMVFPIYIGDDATDEDAFKALKNKGLTIFVGKPKESYAQYYLKNPKEVVGFLRRISEI
ncbi:MAG: trehalose-phosphatase [Candidatus Omnitrophica bacterium]|nr:trehalose-phosphatase [Candidatus Omnitrophota bacterium]MDD5352055.1 trehalose-phosphatase [Candidatus Omnitrophota bacterium]MDD5549653.1 trehalose-phosphatase [Candidatus Omnitrophota bacterium]